MIIMAHSSFKDYVSTSNRVGCVLQMIVVFILLHVEFEPSPRKTNPTLFYETEGLGIYFLFLKATLALGSSIP